MFIHFVIVKAIIINKKSLPYWLPYKTTLVNRVIARSKELKISQKDLAFKSGVSYGSIRRFETTGEISLKPLIQI